MRNHLVTTACLVALASLSACGASVRPSALVKADQFVADKAGADASAKAAPEIFKQAQRYYGMAEEAYQDGDEEDCIRLSTIATIKFECALEHGRRQAAEDRRARAEQRSEAARKAKAQEDARSAEAQKQSKRMEQILALKSKVATDDRDKQRIAKDLAKAQEEARASAAAARAKLEAEKNAAASARAEYDKKRKEIEPLQERENLFKEAAGIEGLQVKAETRGLVLTLYDMFDPGKTVVLPFRAFLLDKIADLAGKYLDYPLVVEGYTDSRGRDADNLALSQSRAQAVHDYLVQVRKLGFDRVKAAGYGEDRPVGDNSQPDGRAMNRRIEVIFLYR